MKRAGWLAASLALLLAVSGDVRTQISEGVTITATITGNFRDADTGQIAFLTLDGLDETNNPPGNWHTIVGEQYTLSIVMESQEPQPMGIVLLDFSGQEIRRAESTQPVQRLSVEGQAPSPYGCQTKYRLRVEYGPRHFPTCQTIWGIWVVLEPYHVPVPPPQFGTVVVHVFDGTNNQPLAGAGIEIPEAGIQTVTNERGIWSGTIQVDPKKGKDITILISGPSVSQEYCKVQRKVRLYPQQTFETSAWLWPHYPIVGRIEFDGSGGDPKQAIVKATSAQRTITGYVDFDGSFTIPGSGAIESGNWTITVTYPEAEAIVPPSKTINVPNDCPRFSLPPFGSHRRIDIGKFVIKLPYSDGG
jgi:hypothetical protein